MIASTLLLEHCIALPPHYVSIVARIAKQILVSKYASLCCIHKVIYKKFVAFLGVTFLFHHSAMSIYKYL